MNEIKHKIDDYLKDNKLDLDRIMDDFEPYVKTIINNMSGNNLSYEDKEEILSDTFFVLWKNQSNIIISLDSYIAGITRNLVREKFKKKKIMYCLSDYDSIPEAYNIDFFPDKKNKIDEIEKTFSNLKDIDFKILTLFYYSSKSTKDIAKELKISEINVRTRLFRVRKKIKKELGLGG